MRPIRQLKMAGLCVAAILATLAPALAVAAQPRSPFVVAAVFPPWWSAEKVRAVADAQGVVSSTGRWNIVVVYGGADVGRRLGQSGAWAILDPSIAGCSKEGNLS